MACRAGRAGTPPTWTLSALIGCYLLLPWICRALWRWPPALVLVGAVIVVMISNLAASMWLGDPIYRLPLRFGIVRALPLFLLGVAAAYYGSRVYVAPRISGAIGLAAAATLIVLQAFGAFSLLSLGLMTVIIWAAGAIPVIKPSRLIEHLALMSFSMFLTNEVTRIVWFGLLEALGQGAPAVRTPLGALVGRLHRRLSRCGRVSLRIRPPRPDLARLLPSSPRKDRSVRRRPLGRTRDLNVI